MKNFKQIAFGFIMLSALLTSGHAAYVVLTSSLGTAWYFAILAAIVVDTAAIWLGTHAAELAALGDSVTKTRIATGFIIVTSLMLNFFYGYNEGTWITGLLACIYPLIAAIIYEFWIEHKIRRSLRERGRILPEKNVYLKSRKYGNKDTEAELEKLRVSLSYETARYNLNQRMVQLQDTQGTHKVHVPEPVTYKGTVYPELDTQQDTVEVQEDTDIDTLFSVVTKEFSEVTLPSYLNLDMDTSEVTLACVENGVTDLDTVEGYMNQIKEGINRNTIKTSLYRAKKKVQVSR